MAWQASCMRFAQHITQWVTLLPFVPAPRWYCGQPQAGTTHAKIRRTDTTDQEVMEAVRRDIGSAEGGTRQPFVDVRLHPRLNGEWPAVAIFHRGG